MHRGFREKLSVILVANSLLWSTAILGQQQREETRPRRAQPETATPQSPVRTQPPAGITPATAPEQWKITQAASPLDAPAGVGAEPTIRVALALDVRGANISTNSRLMRATEMATTLVPLDVTRVHVEARLLSPLPPATEPETFRLKIEGLASRTDADDQAKQIRQATAEESQVAFDVETKTWGLLVGPRRSRAEAEAAQLKLEVAGFEPRIIDLSESGPNSQAGPSIAATSGRSDSATGLKSSPSSASAASVPAASVPSTSAPVASAPAVSVPAPKIDNRSVSSDRSKPANNVRFTARPSLPGRELIASSPTAAKLFNSSAPVIFASDDELRAPVRFNDKPYRGRIEVFANSRGLLTVVNVLGLEDYVRGVVANELSPGGYPAIEALKAQAIAARTYALKNRGQFLSQGFDLLPTTRSQVYRGLTSENPLSTRAVDETRGLVATYNGEPINALYTSTCGGRTEDAANIFNEAIPYLRGRECAAEGRAALAPFLVRSSREPADLREEQHVGLAREVALLAITGFAALPARVSDDWLSSAVSAEELRSWLSSLANLFHQSPPPLTGEATRPPAFATAFNMAAFGPNRADTLLNNADADYYLAARDAAEVPAPNRADVALMLRDGYLSLFPDVTLRPREALSRARTIHAIERLLENHGLFPLQRGTARPATSGVLVLRSAKGKDQPLRVSDDLYLFRLIGETIYPVSTVSLVGGEPVTYHVAANGVVDFLEVRPAANGAAADRFSPFSNWTTELSPGQVRSRLGHYASGIGAITDLRVLSRGASRRVTDLEVVGTDGTSHVRGGRIRSALGLREQLFVIDRQYDSDGHVSGFVFTGRGWGHGVGMCQVGAYGLARQGWSFEQILKAYYTGIELTRIY